MGVPTGVPTRVPTRCRRAAFFTAIVRTKEAHLESVDAFRRARSASRRLRRTTRVASNVAGLRPGAPSSARRRRSRCRFGFDVRRDDGRWSSPTSSAAAAVPRATSRTSSKLRLASRDPEAQAAQINDAVAAVRAVTRAVTHPRPRCTSASSMELAVPVEDGRSVVCRDSDGVGVRPGFEALGAPHRRRISKVGGRRSRPVCVPRVGIGVSRASHPVKSVGGGRRAGAMFTLAGSSSNDVTAAVSYAHLASIVERTTHPDESASRRAASLLASTYPPRPLGRNGRNGRPSRTGFNARCEGRRWTP